MNYAEVLKYLENRRLLECLVLKLEFLEREKTFEMVIDWGMENVRLNDQYKHRVRSFVVKKRGFTKLLFDGVENFNVIGRRIKTIGKKIINYSQGGRGSVVVQGVNLVQNWGLASITVNFGTFGVYQFDFVNCLVCDKVANVKFERGVGWVYYDVDTGREISFQDPFGGVGNVGTLRDQP